MTKSGRTVPKNGDTYSFGHWLRLKRKALDLTREGLAQRVGCSAATIQKLEEEERRPSTQIAERLAEVFSIPSNEWSAFLHFARGNLQSAHSDVSGQFPWQASKKSPRSNLPATLNSLIGREKDIANIREYLLNGEIRLVTLIGPPGIGKTRLSIESAQATLPDFPDGVFFVTLAPLNDPVLIPQTIAQSLGYVQASNLPTEEQLREGIGDKKMLILLDNCEHLIEAAASLASRLLSTCSHLKVLATSRESFRIPGEWLYPVPAFDIPEDISSINLERASNFPALTLFAERARAVQPGFTLNSENIQTVATISAHLDGLPLVIELIAARMRLMSPEALLHRLSDQFILTADGMRAAAERQKTLSNAIEWSYNLLSPEEQKLFACLSVFSGSFMLEDAESIFSQSVTGAPISSLVTSLLDKSLLLRVSNAEAITEPRYTMLVTIQEFARQRLQSMGEHKQARNQHLTYFLDLAEKADGIIRGPKQLEALRRLKEANDNLRTALDWAIETGQTEIALQLIRRLHWSWLILSSHTEARQWFHRVLEMSDAPLYPEVYAEVLAQVAHHISLQSKSLDAKPYSEQALSIARTQKDKHNTARALVMLAFALTDEKNFAAAQSALEESQALFQEVQDEWGYAMAVLILGWSAYSQANWPAALGLMEEALTIYRQLDDRYLMSVVLSQIGRTHEKQGNLTQGETAAKEALILAQQLDSKYEIASGLWFLGEVAQHAERWTRALYLGLAAKKVYESIGAWQPEDDPKWEDRLASCRAVLSESEIAAAVENGRVMTIDEAIKFALQN